MIDRRAAAQPSLLARAAGAVLSRLGGSSLPVPMTFALLVGAGGGATTGLAVLYLASRGPRATALIPFALTLIALDVVLFLVALFVARSLVKTTFRPMRQTLQAVTAMTRDRFVQEAPPRVHGADSREIVTMLWHFGRSLTEQERQLQAELGRSLTELRAWQHRDSQARGLIDLIGEMNQALGLQAVLERLAGGVSRFFAGDGVGVWIRSTLGPDLHLVVQVGEAYPAQLTTQDVWVPLVLGGAIQPVRLAGASITHPSVAVPLTDARGTAVGILVLTPLKRAEYTAQELAFLRGVIGHATLAIQNALAYDETDALSRTDPLTGLQNRREFDRVLKQEVDRATRYQRFL
ncbi:MAG TPA: hypothetical protein VET65_08970, partial [Candidatus Limnocylindrales bacterium]|nr:hypothetical protein [Candidatus Limnocylindrales bacterium]